MIEYDDGHFDEPEPFDEALDRLREKVEATDENTPAEERPKALHVGPKKRLRQLVEERQKELQKKNNRP